MNKLRTQQQAPQSASFSSLDCSKPRKDVSPPFYQPSRGSLQKKHLGAIRPYRPKKSQQQTPSPLAHKEQDSRSRQDSKSISRCAEQQQNSKKQFQSCRPSKKKSDLEQIYKELISLKTEYKALKQAYNSLLKEKQQAFQENKQKSEQLLAAAGEAAKLRKENQRQRSQLLFAQHELERIKKECYKLLEIENFKNQKLDETLQEKELMIHYLRAQLGKENHELNASTIGRNIFLQSTTPIFRSNEFDFVRAAESIKHTNQSVASIESVFHTVQTEQERSKIQLSSISEHERLRNASQLSDDSLMFSRDNPKSTGLNMESIVISPTKQQASDLPSCCTFQLKEQDTEKEKDRQERRFTKRKLEINTEEEDSDYKNVYCDQAPSVETKKRSETGSKPRKHRQQAQSCHPAEHRMRRIDVCLPMDRSHRAHRTNRHPTVNNSSYR